MPRYSGGYTDSKDRFRPITPPKPRSGAKTGLPLRANSNNSVVTTQRPTPAYRQENYYRRAYFTEDPYAWSEPSHLDDVPEKVWEYAYLNEKATPEMNPLRYIDISNTKTPTLQGMRDNRAYYRKKKGIIYDIVLMSPDRYFASVSELKGFSSAREQRASVTEARAQEYAETMRSGDRFALPWLDYDYNGQEGKHRARALEILGVRFFPVMVVRGLD